LSHFGLDVDVLRPYGVVDVVVVYGALHLGQLNWGVDKPVRICQVGHTVRLEPGLTFSACLQTSFSD